MKSMVKRLEVQTKGMDREEILLLWAKCQHEAGQLRTMYNRLVNEVQLLLQVTGGEEQDTAIRLIIKAFEPWE
jgi:hypothetical protein